MSDNLNKVTTSWANFFAFLPNLLILLIIIAACVFGYVFIKELRGELNTQNDKITQIDTTLVNLGNTITKTDSTYVSSDELKEILDKSIKEALKKTGNTPTGNTKVTSRIRGNKTEQPSNKTKDTVSTIIKWPANKSGVELPIANSTYFLDKDSFLNETYPLDFNITVTNAIDSSGKESTFTSVIAVGGTTEYALDINKLEVKKEYPNKSKWHTVPHIDGGGSYKAGEGPGQAGLSIGVTPFAYGPTPDDNLFRVPRVGIAGNKDTQWVELQGGYNVRKPLPLFSDLWIYAGPCVDIKGNMGGCGSITSSW